MDGAQASRRTVREVIMRPVWLADPQGYGARGGFAMDGDLIFDGMYGLAIADALGVPFETEMLASMRESPCEDMVGECRGKEYQNLYGRVLMRVRDELA